MNCLVRLKMLYTYPNMSSKRRISKSLYKLLNLESLLNEISEHDFTLKQIQDMSSDEIFDVFLTFKFDWNQDEIDKGIK